MKSRLEYLLLEAELRYSENNIEAAYQFLKNIFEIDKNYVPAYSFMGKVLSGLGRFEESEQFLNKSIHNNPEDFESKTILGKIKFKQKKYGEAKELFTSSMKINKFFDENYYYLGLGEELVGNELEAQKLFIEAFKTSNCKNYKSLQKIKNKNEYIEIIENIISINEGLVPDIIWNNLSYILTNEFKFITKFFKFLNDTSLSELDYLSFINRYELEKEKFNKFLDLIFRYYKIPNKIFHKLDKLLNSKYFKI